MCNLISKPFDNDLITKEKPKCMHDIANTKTRTQHCFVESKVSKYIFIRPLLEIVAKLYNHSSRNKIYLYYVI